MRRDEKSKFVTSRVYGDNPDNMEEDNRQPTYGADFIKYVPTNSHVPKSQKLVYRRRHEELDAAKHK